jgi:hypothetical protein
MTEISVRYFAPLTLTLAGLHAQPPYAPPNGGRPNPQQAIDDWAELPDARK